MTRPLRGCARCGHRLAADNLGPVCGPCQRTATHTRSAPPKLPAEFWQADQMRDALASWHLGRVIHAYRTHPHHRQTLSQELVGGWLGLTQPQLSRLENGRAPEELSKLIHYSDVLGIPAGLLWFDRPGEPRARAPFCEPLPTVAQTSLLGVEMADDGDDAWRVVAEVGEVVIVAVDRRTFLAGGAAGVWSKGTTALPASRPEVARNVVVHLNAQIDGFYAAEAALGPYPVIPSVLAQQKLTNHLTETARSEDRQDLLRTGAAYGGLLTWLYQDAGDLAAATGWANQTLELAHRVGDTQLIRHALVNKAMIFTDRRDGRGTLDLTAAALADQTRLCAKVRVQALQQAAHGHALVGDRTAVDVALDEAAAVLPRVDDDYPWFNACRRTPGYIEAQRATCYNHLGLGAAARTLWEEVIAGLPPAARRDAGVYRARLAVSCAQAGQPEAAVEAVGQAVAVAVETGSARLRGELHAVWRQLTPWHGTQPGHEVAELLATLEED